MLALLADAATHGLDPADYDAERLAPRADDLAREGGGDAATLAALDRQLTAAMSATSATCMTAAIAPDQLPRGYVDRPSAAPSTPRPRCAPPSPTAVSAKRSRAAAPHFAQYERLREALGALPQARRSPGVEFVAAGAAGGAARQPAEAGGGPTVRRASPLLRERLVALGDLPPTTPLPARYDEALADGVRAFQQRHGLTTDGVIGKATLAQLQVPPAARVRQIELMLERLRWTPLMQGPRMVVINIPEFVLRAYEVAGRAASSCARR